MRKGWLGMYGKLIFGWLALSSSFIFAQADCLAPLNAKKDRKEVKVTKESRKACLEKSSIMFPQPQLTTHDLVQGPQASRGSFTPDQKVNCIFTKHRFSGMSPKFRCHRADVDLKYYDRFQNVISEAKGVDKKDFLINLLGEKITKEEGGHVKADKVRIKYTNGSFRHREVFTEVAASRIFWALGFYADQVYMVDTECVGCKSHPFASGQEKPVDKTTRFFPSSLERKLEGKEIETKVDEGWDVDELHQLFVSGDHQRKLEIESLVLASNLFNYHGVIDFQNRITCLEGHWNKENGVCDKPVMYIQDLGSTFGGKGFIINPRGDFSKWQDVKVFKDKNKCKVTNKFGKIKYISEDSRLYLWERLQHLTADKIKAIFRVAHFEIMDPKLRKEVYKDFSELSKEDLDEKVLDIWTAKFMERVEEVKTAHCRNEHGMNN